MMDENSVESEGAFSRLPDDIEVLRRPRRPMQGSVAGTSISSSHGSVAVFGCAIRRTLDKIIQDEVIVRKGDHGAPGLKLIVTNRSAATQALPIKFLGLGMSRKIKKKKCSHRERRARAKAKVKKFRRRALSVALVVRCMRRPSNKPPTRMLQESKSSEPVRWKWKKRKVGLDSVISGLEFSTLDKFASTSSCAIPRSQSCVLARARVRSPKVNNRILLLRELSAVTSWMSGILCLQINLSVGLLVDFQAGTVARERIVDSMSGLFIMMPHLGSSGLRIKYFSALVRLSWAFVSIYSRPSTTKIIFVCQALRHWQFGAVLALV